MVNHFPDARGRGRPFPDSVSLNPALFPFPLYPSLIGSSQKLKCSQQKGVTSLTHAIVIL